MTKNIVLTQATVATLLRLDPDTGGLHWLNKPRGRQRPDLRAGYVQTRNGKPCARIITIKGARYGESALIQLLTHGAMPARKRVRRPAIIVAPAAPAAATAPAPLAPVPPLNLVEVSKALTAASKAPPYERGWFRFGFRRAA